MFNVLFRKCVHSRSTIINFQVGNYESAHHSREDALARAHRRSVRVYHIHVREKHVGETGVDSRQNIVQKLESQLGERDRYLYTTLFNTLL